MLDQLYSQQITPKGQIRSANHHGPNIETGNVAHTTTSLPVVPPQQENKADNKTTFSNKPAQDNQFKSELAKTGLEASESQPSNQEDQSFGFFDFLDVINPLQHIPVISTLYREITGDEIQPAARVVGGMIYGGPTGFVSAIANSIVEETTGKDIGENIMEAFLGSDEDENPVQTAALEAYPEDATTPLFSQLAPVIPPAPIQQPKLENAATSHNPGSASPLEGKAALTALYNDLAPSSTTEPVSQQIRASNASLNVPQGGSTTLATSKPGKWFPLSGGNVLIAQTSHLPQARPSESTSQQVESPTTLPRTDNAPSTEETIASIESDFAQNLLNGLDKYQQLKSLN
ncbi:hypothetical protein [Kiloniella majae]|uniref:hypothetical protein n=1 Tax=Kiloniella majae TaxID=1938558 RepID=UPI000A278F2A|nr:hypothetical protein [Kiloniella majae]